MINIISNDIIPARLFAQYYSNLYFMRCDTYNETWRCLASQHIYIGQGVPLTQINTLPDGVPCVIVEFSTERNYTEHEYRIIRIQKKYLKRFMKNMQESEQEKEELYNETNNNY